MALFKAKALLEGNKPHPVDIQLGHIEEEGKILPVVLTLNMSDTLIKVYQEADELYHASPRLPILSRKEAKKLKQVEARIINDYVTYCTMILEEGYLDSQNIVDTPSKDALIAAVKQEPGFAERLAQAINYYFKGDGRLNLLEDMEKN